MSKKKTVSNPVQIVVMHRGWVVVGRTRVEPSPEGKMLVVEGGAVIRRWGTTKGLGEIAEGGPTRATVLDPCPTVRALVGTYIYTMDCDASKWETSLRSGS